MISQKPSKKSPVSIVVEYASGAGDKAIQDVLRPILDRILSEKNTPTSGETNS